MRRGEVVGLKWSDFNDSASRLSISRTLQNVGGRPVEFGVKTRTSRRTVDVDAATVAELVRWSGRLDREGLAHGSRRLDILQQGGAVLEPRIREPASTASCGERRCRAFASTTCACTHASLLVAAGAPIKVVSERLGHAHPAFTMRTYQHLLPGMSAAAAEQFAALVGTSGR